MLALSLAACADAGIGGEPEVNGKADTALMAQEASAESERYASEPETATDGAQLTSSAQEKALRGPQRRLARAPVAASPAARPAPFVSGKLVAAALSVDLNLVGADLKTAHLNGDPAAEAIHVHSILANDRYFGGSNGIIPNNPTPYSCCLAGYPSHSIGALYSYVTGGLTLSNKMNVWTARTPRDPQEPTVMVRQAGDLAFRDDEKVLLNTTHASWIGPSSYHVQLQVASDVDPAAFRLCWHVSAPSVRRLACGIYSRASAAFRGIHVIDDSAAPGPRTFRMVDPQ